MVELYELFRPIFVAALLAHVLGLAPQWFRYVGPKFDPGSALSTRFRASISLVIAGSLAGLSFFVTPAFLLLPLFFLLNYVHISRRFDSLGRGAGAVGIIPQSLALFLVVSDFVLSYSANAEQLLSFSTFGFLIYWAGILINSGLVKLQEGYWGGFGIRSYLSNPHWGRFWPLFETRHLNSSKTGVLGKVAVFTEIIGGIALLIPGLNRLGVVLIAGMFLAIGIFIKLYSLPWLSLLVMVYFLFSTIGPLEVAPTFNSDLIGVEELVFTIIVMAYSLLAGVSQIVGAVLVGLQSLGLISDHVFSTRLAKFLLIFRWRVFTYGVISTCVTFKDPQVDGGPQMAQGYLLARALNPFYTQATESVAITSVFNTLKSETFWEKFYPRMSSYVRSGFCPKSEILFVMWVCFEEPEYFEWLPVLTVSSTDTDPVFVADEFLLSKVFPEEVVRVIFRNDD